MNDSQTNKNTPATNPPQAINQGPKIGPASNAQPPPLPNLEERAVAFRTQSVLEVVMSVRAQIGSHYQRIEWTVMQRDQVTKGQIAEALGVSERSVRNWVAGESAPRITEQATLFALDSGLLVIKVLPDSRGHRRAVLVPGPLAGQPAKTAPASAAQQSQNADKR